MGGWRMTETVGMSIFPRAAERVELTAEMILAIRRAAEAAQLSDDEYLEKFNTVEEVLAAIEPFMDEEG